MRRRVPCCTLHNARPLPPAPPAWGRICGIVTQVRVGVVKRTGAKKSTQPLSFARSQEVLAARTGIDGDRAWSTGDTTKRNYRGSGVLLDPNAACARGDKAAAGRAPECEDRGNREDSDLDDDLRSALGRRSKSGSRPPSGLTATQRDVIVALHAKHGDDVEAMTLDRRLNRMLLPASKLRRMLAAFRAHPSGGSVRFQQPKRKLW